MTARATHPHLTTVTATSYPGAADLAPGYFLTIEFSSIGGSKVETSLEKSGSEARMVKHIRYDHRTLHESASTLMNKAHVVMRRYCSPTFGGLYFVSERDFSAMDDALQELRDMAHLLNKSARAIHSPRQTIIEVYRHPIDKADHRNAVRVGKTMYEDLSQLRESYSSDVKNDFNMKLRVCRNFDKMVTGFQSTIVAQALQSANDQRTTMIANFGGRRGVIQVLNDNRGKVPDLDYGPIDKAIELFQPAAEAFL